MRRREFIRIIAGPALAWPLAAHAQQGERVRRIGVLIARAATDPEAAEGVGAFVQGLAESGWTIGRNVRIEYRYGAGDPEMFRKYATELVALAPDVILAIGTPSVAALQQSSRSLSIVFALVTDPVGAGFVDSVAHPGGNTTGFMLSEYSLNAKLLELLKQVAPGVKRVAVLRDSVNPAGMAQFGTI
jgi:putative ABC transport system substrate-binding protein